MRIRLRPNRQLRKELEQAPTMRARKRIAANAIKREAERLAPRQTGRYARSFKVVYEDGTYRVGNTDIAAHLIEWGSVKNPPYAPLRRAVHAAGFRLRQD